jgi:hypothetical protein
MSQKLEDVMCKFIQSQTGILKRYLLVAMDSQDQFLRYLDMSMGTPLPSIDVRNCELLTDAGIFMEEIKITRDGRNRYKEFYLTAFGKEIAKQTKEECCTDEMPENTQIPEPSTEQTKMPS